MSVKNLNATMANAAKWSLLTEIVAKILQPVTNAVLARLLIPEAFGLVATINMVISFTDIFTDAGFQKYIVQHEFENEKQKKLYVNVAFWSNLIISIALLIVICCVRDKIAILTGSPNLGKGIAVAALSLPITSFSSIQMSIFRRELNFKTLFIVRIASALVPFVITIPLAYFLRSYWALVIGTLIGNAVTSVLLTVLSDWKPEFQYKLSVFKDMFGFCYWILVEAILIWLTSYIGTFIVGRYLSAYYLGVYKTSITTVSQIMSLVTAATTPVIFSATSRLQENTKEMYELFLKSLRLVSLLLIPMGIGVFIYRNTITAVMLGNQWGDAVLFIGIYGVSNAFSLILASYWDSLFNAVGKPQYSVLTQFLYLLVSMPLLLYSAKNGFSSLVLCTCFLRLAYIVIELIAVKLLLHIGLWKGFSVVLPSVLASIPMVVFGIWQTHTKSNILFDILGIVVCIILYFATCVVIKPIRKDLYGMINTIKAKGN